MMPNTISGDPKISEDHYKWIIQNIQRNTEFVHLNELQENEYEPYPVDDALRTFDPTDKKYILLAFIHKDFPPIVEAADSKMPLSNHHLMW